MAEVLLSPGVLARENDSSQVSSQPIEAGCAIVGPTVKGPVNIPTIVTSYSDYQNRFGTVVESGSNEYTYFTSVSAYNYFQQGGDSLLVTRVVSGSYTSATSSKIENSDTAVAGAKAAASFNYLVPTVNYGLNINTPTTNPMFISSSFSYNLPGADLYYYTGSQAGFVGKVNEIIGSSGTNEIIINEDGGAALSITASVAGISFNGSTVKSGSYSALLNGNGVTIATLAGGTASTFNSTLELETLAVGAIQNNTSTEGSRGQLASGTKDNVRWEVISPDTASGTFSLLIRQGDDITSQKKVLETWTNLSLDPNASNYVSRVIGDQKQSVKTDGTTYYLQMEGQYANASRYVRVKSVNSKTLNYFDNAGDPKSQYTSSIPVAGSGSFGAALGIDFNNISANFNQNINATNTQGLIGSNYTTALNLLANKDEFQYNVLSIPGLYREDYASQISSMVNNCQFRGDSIAVIDGVAYDKSITAAKTQAAGVDSSYAAMYWPWLQTIDPDLGDQVWVPASAMMPGVFAYNDSVSEAWFAPAGLNRGGLSSVIRAERKLTNGNRDELYQANINPIATFPNTGVVVFGQKTLQKKASALDRVNVRRLLIALKGFISQIADNLVFEQNTIATRNNFLAQVNPYLESVQQRQGLYAFKVVMDDSNNTPDVIDRNQLIGQIYLQPTKTAEFIYLDFNVLLNWSSISIIKAKKINIYNKLQNMPVIDPNEIFFTAFEPKQANRFILYMDGIPSFIVKGVSAVSLSQGEVILNHINIQRKVKGKTTWNDITMTLFDPITPSGAQAVMEWVRLHHESVTGRDGYSDFYKKDLRLDVLGPVGDIVSEWILKGAFVKESTFGDYNWDTENEAKQIEVTLAVDYCVLNF